MSEKRARSNEEAEEKRRRKERKTSPEDEERLLQFATRFEGAGRSLADATRFRFPYRNDAKGNLDTVCRLCGRWCGKRYHLLRGDWDEPLAAPAMVPYDADVHKPACNCDCLDDDYDFDGEKISQFDVERGAPFAIPICRACDEKRDYNEKAERLARIRLLGRRFELTTPPY